MIIILVAYSLLLIFVSGLAIVYAQESYEDLRYPARPWLRKFLRSENEFVLKNGRTPYVLLIGLKEARLTEKVIGDYIFLSFMNGIRIVVTLKESEWRMA